MEEGKKFDNGKLRYDLLPADAIEEVIKVLMNGAAKYGDSNWKKVDVVRYYNALMRHTQSWRKGERIDKDSKLKTLAHAAANTIILLKKEIDADLEAMEAEHLKKENKIKESEKDLTELDDSWYNIFHNDYK